MQVWYGTVDQIEELYGVEQVSVNMEGVKNQEQFMQRVRPLLIEHNQVKSFPLQCYTRYESLNITIAGQLGPCLV